MRARRSVIVVGGGFFGAVSALSLHARGFRVSLFDPGPLPHPLAASTDITKMVRMDYGADDFYTEMGERALLGWDEWNRRWGEALYHQDGFLIMARSPMRPGEFEYESFRRLNARGHHPERLNSERLRERYPAWSAEKYPDGYFNPRGGWAASGKVLARLIDEGRAAGITVRDGVGCARLLERDSRIVGIAGTDGGEYRADFTVVAAGVWTPALLPHLADVMWAVGQPVLHLRPRRPERYRPPHFPPWAADIGNTGWYGFPALADGTLKVANHGVGRRVHPDGPREISDEDEPRFREFFRDTFPDLADAPRIGERLCLYCDTWDGDFWIDRDADRPGLVVATGGSGHAFKFAPVLGDVVADVLEGRENRDAARFAARPPGNDRKEDARCYPAPRGDK